MPKFKCSECGEYFDPAYENYEHDHHYTGLMRPVCSRCESELWENAVEDVFLGECEECGKEIDVMKEFDELSSNHPDNCVDDMEIDLEEYKGFCADCADDKVREKVRELKEEADEYGYF